MLSDPRVRAAKPAEKDYRLVDGEGLHPFVTTRGAHAWRWRHKVGGVEKLLSLGQGLGAPEQQRFCHWPQSSQ